MEINKEIFNNLPGIGTPEWEYLTASFNLGPEQFIDMKSNGLEPDLIISNVMENELFAMLSKIISVNAFNNKSAEIKWQDESIYWLRSLIDQHEPEFIITNSRTGAALSNMSDFLAKPLTDKAFSNGSGLYLIGQISNVPIYTDPYMLWIDNRLALVENNFLEFEIDDIKIEKNTKTCKTNDFSMIYTTKLRFKRHNAKASVYNIKDLNF